MLAAINSNKFSAINTTTGLRRQQLPSLAKLKKKKCHLNQKKKKNQASKIFQV
jgi:hypothetical protein